MKPSWGRLIYELVGQKDHYETELGQINFRVWLGFFRFAFGSVWFFQFQAYKTETEPNRSVFSKF